MPHFNIIWNSVTKATGDSGIKNRVSLPSNQHFPQCLISTSCATASQRQQETQELKTESHCHQINIFLNASFQHHVQQHHKGNRRLRVKNRLSLPNQHFPQCLISSLQPSQRQQETQELKTESHSKSTFSSMHFNIIWNSVTKATGDSGIKNTVIIETIMCNSVKKATGDSGIQSHCHQINIFLNASFQHHMKQRHKGNRRLRN